MNNPPAVSKSKNTCGVSSFTVIMVFLLFSLIGLSLIPLLSVQMEPTVENQSLKVMVSWPNVTAEVLEVQVTSPMEGALAQIKGLSEIHSSSHSGRADISLTFDQTVNLPVTRLEVLSILRAVYPKLPQGVERPILSAMNSDQGATILGYSIIGQGSSLEAENYLKNYFVPALSGIKGVYGVSVYGAIPKEWVLEYDPILLKNNGISEQEIAESISEYLADREIGKDSEADTGQQKTFAYIRLKGGSTSRLDLGKIPVKRINSKVIFLSELAKLSYKESVPQSYYRINGLNRVNLMVNALKDVNTIELADKVKKEIEKLKAHLPAGYSLLLEQDATAELKSELYKLTLRCVVTVMILLFFVFLVNRQWKYMLVVFLSLIANMLISCVLYYLLKIEIHLYTLAAITVSLGLVIDTIMVMADHYRQKGNRYVFLALLASVFTTIGALLVVFFMNGNAMENMWDFAAVQAVTLLVSLFIAWFLVPAITDQLQWQIESRNSISRTRAKRILRFNRIYRSILHFSIKKKWWLAAGFVLLFGLPLFLLPKEIISAADNSGVGRKELEPNFSQQCYNATFGSDAYRTIRQYTDPALGGTLRWFASYVKEPGKYQQAQQRTIIDIEVFMPPGATLGQMNSVFIDLENSITPYKEIEKFVSQIDSPQSASMQIIIKKEFENSRFPHVLKGLLVRRASEMGSADFTISGVGQGFSNLIDESKNSSIELYGYNFEELMQQARNVAERLKGYARVKDVEIATARDRGLSNRREFVIVPDKEQLAVRGSSISGFYGDLNYLNISDGKSFNVLIGSELEELQLKPLQKERVSLWEVSNYPINQQNRAFKLTDAASIANEKQGESIEKINQEYKVYVNYDIIGGWEHSTMVYNEVIEKTRQSLPFGFRVQKQQYEHWDPQSAEQYWYVVLGCIIIFFICAVLLESLRQAAVITGLIPLSFIGLFAAFIWFDANFDQGGYAAFLLLSGQTVVSALFIVNDFNHILKVHKAKPATAYLKAYHHKIIPIMLTIISTVLGFVPFLWGDKQEGFWFSLGVGTSGGLLFSLLVLPVYLPLFLGIDPKVKLKQEKKNNRTIGNFFKCSKSIF
ncbi:efflux RND transporter permease subunit [Flavobacterium sharifuzzamanii]|uniref:efflux RND transporter permease subunit n=1 Tax=Flavobacterium sharifuzzamanii TaxID=2211133 RepID=UPI0013009435|nr:efflux RND transporter permease subunit [Flavobacterium sharifuzzamanii]KAF2080131.1 efflux RND transporter permease subunit [Flavobacterium sharifuzzamanii]